MGGDLLFQKIKFISDEADSDAVQMLLTGGATQFSSLASAPGHTPLHLITGDYNSPVSLAAQQPPYNSRVLICTSEWVRSSTLKSRIQDVRRFSPDPRQFFTGVCVTCSGLPSGDKEAIYGGVLALGGQYSDNLVKGTTHVVALTADSDKVQEVLNKEDSGIEVVLPHWFDDCLRLRRRIPSGPYRFPEPRILQTNLSAGAPVATSQDADFRHICDPKSSVLEAPGTTEDVFGGKKFFIGTDLDLGERLLGTLCTVLGSANAILVRHINLADVYIGRYREGREYLSAARSNKVIGNYTWIIYCLVQGKYSAPREHLLHYPLARGGLAEFKNDVITVSNYTGEARLYLERLITALGADFTRNMKPTNTHLITSAENGEKYNTAVQWGIPCVNHLWLEESYAKWQKQAITQHHYVTFPKETNLMDVIAQTHILNEGIEPFYLEDDTADEDESPETAVAVLVPSKVNDSSVPMALEPADESQDIELPARIDLQQQATAPDRTVSNPKSSAQENSDSGSDLSELREKDITTAATPRAKSATKDTSRATPIRINDTTPSSRGSATRKASQTAASRLRDNMEDANKFGQQMRNKHSLPPLPSEQHPPSKKIKSTDEPTSQQRSIKVVMTGCPELTEKIESQAEAIGISFVDDPHEATHLLAPRVARTRKFVVAIPTCKYFVNWNWLLASIKAQKIEPESDYQPEAAASANWSKRLDFSKVLDRRKTWQEKGGLFHGLTLLISDAVAKVGGFDTYRDIVESNGGVCGLIGKRGVNVKGNRVIMVMESKSDPAYSKRNELKKSGSKGKENKDARELETADCYDREWLMICAIRQELLFEEKLKLV